MGAEFFSVQPRTPRDAARRQVGLGPRLRQAHRWTSIAFTLAVVANFAAMTRGAVPAVITYAPLPPLFVMTVTGLYMLARHFGHARRHVRSIAAKG